MKARILLITVVSAVLFSSVDSFGAIGLPLPPALEKILNTPEDKFDLGRAAAELSAFVNEEDKVDVEKIVAKLDEMSGRLMKKLEGKESGSEKIHALLEFIETDEKFFPLQIGIFNINRVLRLKAGGDAGMSLLAVILARRVGLPVHARIVPDHMFIRYEDESMFKNIDFTWKRREYPNDIFYRKHFKLSFGLISKGYYLSKITPGQILGVLALRSAWMESGPKSDDLLRFAEKLLPGNPEVLLARARALAIAKKDYAASVEAFEKYLEIVPEYDMAWAGLGNSLKEAGQLERAEKAYRKCVEIRPDSFYNRRLLVLFFNATKQYEKAVAAIRKTLDINPRNLDAVTLLADTYLKMKKVDKGVEVFDEALKLNEKDYTFNLEYGRFLSRAGLQKRALLRLNKARDVDPTNYEIYTEMSFVHAKMHLYEEALEDVKTAARLDPKNEFLYTVAGGYYNYMFQPSKAEDAFLKALKIRPSYTLAKRRLALLYMELGKFDEAEKMVESMLKQDPENKDGYLLLVDARLQEHLGKNKLAERKYMKASKMEWDEPDAGISSLALHYFRTNRLKEAEPLLAKVADMEDDCYYHLVLYIVRMRLGRKDAAEKGIAEASEKADPEDEWHGKIIDYYAGKISADELIEKAKHKNPARVKQMLCEGYYFIAARMLATGGDREKAKKYLRKCRALNVYYFHEHEYSRIELERLKMPGQWH